MKKKKQPGRQFKSVVNLECETQLFSEESDF